MSDYIKKEYAIDILNAFEEEAGNRGDTEVEGTCMLARNAVIDLPSIDIVRCKDCKYSEKAKTEGVRICKRLLQTMIWEDDDYCSHGERK